MSKTEDRERHGRLPWFLPEDLTPEQREYYNRLLSGPRSRSTLVDDRGRLQGAFNARLLDPPVGSANEQLGAVLRFATPALTGRQREAAILEVACFERSGYEWLAHSRTGAAAGLTPRELDAILRGADAETFSEQERLTRRVVRALTTERDLTEDLYEEAAAGLGLVALFDLVSLVGYYQHTALALRVWRVPDDHSANPFADKE